jgi:hypothetical protein
LVRRVFFSYHFDQDAWRANQVRKSWVTKPTRNAAGFFDAADQEEVKRSTDEAIKRWIDSQLRNTSVTAVLIGEETASREYVQYEIERSFARGNALLGIQIHEMKDREGRTSYQGDNPLGDYVVETDSGRVRLSEIYPTYDWDWDDGQQNTAGWIKEANAVKDGIPREWQDNLVRADQLDESSWRDAAVTSAATVIGFGIGAAIVDELTKSRNQRRYK